MFVFRLRNEKATKHLWKCAVEHHTFFRLRATAKGPSARQNFFRMGSRFRYSGRTEFQNTVTERRSRRTTVQFERRPSQRYARRQSHVLREKDRERKKREAEAKLESSKKKTSTKTTTTTTATPAAPATETSEAVATATLVEPIKPNEAPAPTSDAENRLDDLIKSLQKVSVASTSAASSVSTVTSATSFKPSTTNSEIPNNQSGLASTTSTKLPLDNYKNNILKAKSQDENKKVGGNAMLSFSSSAAAATTAATASSSTTSTVAGDDKSR